MNSVVLNISYGADTQICKCWYYSTRELPLTSDWFHNCPETGMRPKELICLFCR